MRARLACSIDLQEKEPDIESFLRQNNDATVHTVYVSSADKTSGELLPSVSQKLDVVVRQFDIQGVIISTEPLSHLPYARWALRNGLSVLMDKPISTREGVSTSEVAADDILRDYDGLLQLYTKAKDGQRAVRFSVTAQRRYHAVFCKAKELVREVFEKTNVPSPHFSPSTPMGNGGSRQKSWKGTTILLMWATEGARTLVITSLMWSNG